MALARSLDVHLTVIKQNKLAASFTNRWFVCNRALTPSRLRDVDAVEFRGLCRACIRDGHLVAICHRSCKRRERQPDAVDQVRAELRGEGAPRWHRAELHFGLRGRSTGAQLLNL